MTDVTIPDWWDGDTEAAIAAWFYEDGDRVEAGSVVAEVMLEKSAFELMAPVGGRLNILAPAESIVRKTMVVARIAA